VGERFRRDDALEPVAPRHEHRGLDGPTFTVVMPAHNTASTVGQAIASVLAQTRTDLELVVVDDGSTDGTAEEARRFEFDSRVRVLQQDRGGAGAARNLAIAHARGRCVSMLDSDDLWLPTYLQVVGDALERYPDVGLAHTGHWVLEEPPGLVRRLAPSGEEASRPTKLDADELLVRLTQTNTLVNSTVTVRRPVLDEVGGCDTTLAASIDFELWLRIAAAGYGIVRAPGRHAVYRWRRGSIQSDPRNEVRSHRSLREVYRRVAEEWDVPADVKALATSRVSALDRRIDTLTGKRRLASALLALRRRLGRVKRRLLRRRRWYSSAPLEVAETLERVRGPVRS
jgi:glycosyltransferase involved in cell wall biosynthesis